MAAPFAVTLLCDAIEAEARVRVREGFDAAGRGARIFETDEAFAFSTDFLPVGTDLLDRIAVMARQSGPQRLIAVSDRLAVAGEHGPEPSEIAKQIRDLLLPTRHLCGLVALVPSASRRIRDIDRVVDTRRLAPEIVRDAVAGAAGGLWLKAPPTLTTTLPPGAAITVGLVDSVELLRRCFELRWQVYSAMGYLDEALTSSPARIEMDWFDLSSLHFAAIDHASGRLAGTTRLVLAQFPRFAAGTVVGMPSVARDKQSGWCRKIADSEPTPIFRQRLGNGYFFPLPILQSTDFRDRWPRVIGEAGDGGEISRVVVAPRYRGAGISRLLVRAAIAVAHDLRKRHMMLECIPAHVVMYEKHGFTPLAGYHTRTTGLDQDAVGMTLTLDDRPDNMAASQARRDLEMIRRGTARATTLGGGGHLCLCQHTLCWRNGRYDLRAQDACPLHRLHRR